MGITSPTPPTTTTPLRVPGVIQPTVTDSTTSSVTASPDVIVTGTLTVVGETLTIAVSGHQSVGFSYADITGPTLVFEFTLDGTTWTRAQAANYTSSDGTYGIVASTSATGGTLSLILPSGTQQARVRKTVGAAGTTVVLTATAQAGITAAVFASSVVGLVTPPLSAVQIGGRNAANSGLLVPYVATTLPGTSDQGLVTREVGTALSTTFGAHTFPLIAQSPLRLGGTPFTLRAAGTAGGFAPPIVTATQPPQTVMTFSGKIPGATINNYVIDAVTIRILGPAAVAAGLFGRVVKRHILYASTQTAAPAAGAVPTGAVLAYTNAPNASGTFQYKYVAVDIWGNEGNYSAASANVSPGANQGVTVTCPAVPAGAAGYNVYRTVTGPGATWFFLGRTNTTTFRDITPDSALTLAAGTIATWSTLPAIETVNAPMELVMEKFVALTGTAPVIISTKTFPGTNTNNRVVTIAPGVAVGRYRIPGEVEAKAFLAAPTITTALARDIDTNYTYGGSTQINAAFGDIAVNSFNQSDAGMGGTFVVWGHELVGVTEGSAASATAGFGEASAFSMKWVAPPVFSASDEIAIEVGSSITNNAVSLEVMVSGRYF